jgi:hypothetical protein
MVLHETAMQHSYSNRCSIKCRFPGRIGECITFKRCSSLDGLIFDQIPHFDLLSLYFPDKTLWNESHSYYLHVLGQLLIIELQWCNFEICFQEYMLLQRIHLDLKITSFIREEEIFVWLIFLRLHYIVPAVGCLQLWVIEEGGRPLKVLKTNKRHLMRNYISESPSN